MTTTTRLGLTRLEPRDCPALYAAAGEQVYQFTAAGDAVDVWTPFPGVPVAAVAEADGRVWVGAGPGGSPHARGYDALTRREVASLFVGDPDSRAGVTALWASPSVGVRAVPHPVFPAGDRAVARVQARLDRLPPDVVRELGGLTVYAHTAPAVVDLPELAYLRGVGTANTLDYADRTYDAVRSAASRAAVWVGDPADTLHEIGHAVAFARGLDLSPDEHEHYANAFAG